MFSKLVIAATAALSVLSPALADCTRNYTVAEGDICDWISKSQNVSTYQLAAVNVDVIDSTCSNLTPGQNLCLGNTGEDCTDIYVVKDADSCESITSQYNLNSTILALNNPNIDDNCDNLYTGEVLCVATTVVAPPIPTGFFNTTTGSSTTTSTPSTTDDGSSGDDGSDDNDDSGSTEWVPVQAGSDDDDGTLPYCDDVDGDDDGN